MKHDAFIAQQKDTYQEIGIVLDVPPSTGIPFSIKDKVYFDSWLAKKYPIEGETDKFYWLVRFEDIVAYEEQVSE